MAAVDPKGQEDYWNEGESFKGVRLQTTQTGREKYWLNGEAEYNLFPYNNLDTGKMFILFE